MTGIELKEMIAYIQKNSDNIIKFSDKLSETEANLKETIAYIQKRADNIVKYSDKLSKMIKSIDSGLCLMFKKNGLEYIDKISLSNTSNVWLKIGIYENSCWGIIVKREGNRFNSFKDQFLVSSNRNIKKEAVKRLPEFLKNYAEFLKKEETEYKEVSELAEKINDAAIK